MATDNELGIYINTVANDTGLTETTAQITAMGTAAKAASTTSISAFESFNASLKRVGTQMTAVGRSMTTFITLPIAAIGYESVKSALNFQQAMTYIRTDAGDTTDDINKMGDAVLALAKKSQIGPDELAKGLYHLASLGLRGADAINALNTAQQMASVGGADLESTASALGAALVTGIKGVQDYTSAAGVLDATIGAGNMRMQDLVGALGTGVLPVFKNAGLTITEFGAALATLTDNGQQADAAATHLRMTIALMQAPSGPARQALEDIGMAANQLGMDMQTKGLIPALKDLRKHLIDTYGTTAEGKTKMAAALVQMFGGGRSSAAIQTLIDQIGRVQSKEKQIAEQSGEFAGKYAEQQKTAAAKFKTAWSAIQTDLIRLGTDIMPEVTQAATTVAGAINKLSSWFEHLSKGQKQFVVDAVLVVAAMGPVLLIFGTLASSLSNIITLSLTVGRAFGTMAAAAGTSGLLMAGVFAGLVVDIALVYNAIQSVIGAFHEMDAANKSAQGAKDAKAQEITTLQNLMAHGTPEQKLRASTLYRQEFGTTFATGTSYAPGGMAIVGEHGPEAMYVPRGAQITPTRQTPDGAAGGRQVKIEQHNTIYTQFDMNIAAQKLGFMLQHA
jgi:TP901 family phage tail tape measure protein